MVGGRQFFEQNIHLVGIWGSENPQVIEERRSFLRRWCDAAEISLNMCQKVVENYLKSSNACNTSCDGHLIDVVFHS